ncbi:MAG: sulfite exporter TauE/SafE family protein [Acidimicrobiales bacterium]|nr:sulfite exporter TauE/SafE family protein [Acidimicrobiales bacterium]
MRALLASPLGFLIGLSLGALGGGGSILAVPALVYGAGQDPKAATTTSLLIVGLSALFGMVSHWRAGRVRVGTGLVFGAVGIGGSLLGSSLNRSVDPNVLLLAFSGLMMIAAWRMWVSSRRPAPVATASAPRSVGAAVNTIDARHIDLQTVLKVLFAGSLVGLLTGFFGVGGGFVIVPALVLALRFEMPEAVGTSLLVIAVNSAFALSQRVATTGIDWRTATPFLLAAMMGVLSGTELARKLPAQRLARWFVALLVAVAAYTALRSILAL